MKRKLKISLICYSIGVLSLQSCLDFDQPIDDFRPTDILIDESGTPTNPDSIDSNVTYNEVQVDSAIKNMENYFGMLKTAQFCMRGGKDGLRPVSHAYQRHYTLPDVYAQYAVIPHTDFAFAGSLTSSYNVSPDWIAGPNGQFTGARISLAPVMTKRSSDTIPEIKAIALLLYDYAAIENVDLYGTTAYSDFKTNKENPPFVYEDMKTIYTKVEKNINTIVECFRNFNKKPAWYQDKIKKIIDGEGVDREGYSQITYDFKYGIKDMETWIRFANSLKLRMAMHIVKVEPVLAKQWAEDAVKGGVIDDTKYEIYLSTNKEVHPLVDIVEIWNDTRFSASFISLLKSLKHPYRFSLCMKNTGAFTKNDVVSMEAEKEVVGIRSGIRTGEGQNIGTNQFIGFSRINKVFIEKAPLYLFKWAEIDFLRAEGALRGWNMGGTAEFFYNRGIDNSSLFEPGTPLSNGFKQRALPSYKEVSVPEHYTYVDPTGSSPNIESVTKIGVKWNEKDSKETKLEKIITQKYIALFPNSMEAWGEMRRTGYPKMFPVLNVEEGDGSLKPGDLVRRILFPNTDDASLKDIKSTGLKSLGGPDKQATRVWWDVKGKGNF